MTIEEVLANRSAPDENGCVMWLGGKHAFGYGQCNLDGKPHQLVHRVVWEHYNGPIPKGVWVLHSCDVPGCCNPDHLFLGNAGDNVRDMVEKDRQAKGELVGLAKLEAKDVVSMRRAHRLGATITDLANRYSVGVGAIHNALTGKTWKHISGALREEEIHHDGLKGSGSGVNKLSAANVRKIRKLYADGENTPDLAGKFGVCAEQIRCVLTGYSWAHIPGAVKQLRHGRVGAVMAKKVAEMGAQGIQGRIIAQKLGINEPVVYRVLSGRSYSRVTGINPKEHKDGRARSEKRDRKGGKSESNGP